MPQAKPNSVFLGWKHSTVGREKQAEELFSQAKKMCESLKASGKIDNFEFVLLMPYGGDLNGFILIESDPSRLDEIMNGDDFMNLVARAGYSLDGFRVIRAFSQNEADSVVSSWSKLIG